VVTPLATAAELVVLDPLADPDTRALATATPEAVEVPAIAAAISPKPTLKDEPIIPVPISAIT
jgi:hypothetical protein